MWALWRDSYPLIHGPATADSKPKLTPGTNRRRVPHDVGRRRTELRQIPVATTRHPPRATSQPAAPQRARCRSRPHSPPAARERSPTRRSQLDTMNCDNPFLQNVTLIASDERRWLVHSMRRGVSTESPKLSTVIHSLSAVLLRDCAHGWRHPWHATVVGAEGLEPPTSSL
jgi:hypothetical protein